MIVAHFTSRHSLPETERTRFQATSDSFPLAKRSIMAENLSSNAPTRCVGPSFEGQDRKPSATVSVEVPFDNVRVLPQTPQLIALLS